MTTIVKSFIALVIVLIVAITLFGINSAKIKACDTIGGTTVTNFGFVVRCDPPHLFGN